jgi:hypothetical protein
VKDRTIPVPVSMTDDCPVPVQLYHMYVQSFTGTMDHGPWPMAALELDENLGAEESATAGMRWGCIN